MSNAEAWLEALARAAREEDPVADPRWEKLVRGELSAEEEADLRARAERSPADRATFEALRPLEEADLRAIEARVFDAMDAPAPGAPAPRTPGDAPSTIAAAPTRGAAVIPMRRRRVRVAIGAAAAALVMAASAILALRAGPHRALPLYEMSVIGGERDDRSLSPEPGAVRRLGPGSQLELLLQPKVPVDGPVGVRGALLSEGRWEAWRPPFEITPEGIVRIAGTREAVFAGVPDGAWEIVLLVARPEALPAEPAATEVAPPSVQVFRTRVLLARGQARP